MTRIHLAVDVNSVFHLPGKHNQKSHDNRSGKKDNTPAKTSKHAPIAPDVTPAEVIQRVDEIHEDNAAAPVASSRASLSPFEFEDQVGTAAAGEDAFQELTFPEIIVNRKTKYRVVRNYRDYDEENDVDTRIIDVEVVNS